MTQMPSTLLCAIFLFRFLFYRFHPRPLRRRFPTLLMQSFFVWASPRRCSPHAEPARRWI